MNLHQRSTTNWAACQPGRGTTHAHDTRCRAQKKTGDPARHSVAGGPEHAARGVAAGQGRGGHARAGQGRAAHVLVSSACEWRCCCRELAWVDSASAAGASVRPRGPASAAAARLAASAICGARASWLSEGRRGRDAGRAFQLDPTCVLAGAADWLWQNVWRQGHGAAGYSPLSWPGSRFLSLIDLSRWASRPQPGDAGVTTGCSITCFAPNGSVHRRPQSHDETGMRHGASNLQPPKPWRHPSRSPLGRPRAGSSLVSNRRCYRGAPIARCRALIALWKKRLQLLGWASTGSPLLLSARPRSRTERLTLLRHGTPRSRGVGGARARARESRPAQWPAALAG